MAEDGPKTRRKKYQAPARTYAEKLRDPRWQRMRLEVLKRDEWECQSCHETTITLHVHHRWYEKGRDPWDYPMEALVTLCEVCHEAERAERKDSEQELLHLLSKHLLAHDLESLVITLKSMPTDALMSLADGADYPAAYVGMQEWLATQVADFAEWQAARRAAE